MAFWSSKGCVKKRDINMYHLYKVENQNFSYFVMIINAN